MKGSERMNCKVNMLYHSMVWDIYGVPHHASRQIFIVLKCLQHEKNKVCFALVRIGPIFNSVMI